MVVDSDNIETVAVIGAGEMGHGIGAVAALAGYETAITDIDESQLEETAEQIEWSYEKSVEKGKATDKEADATLERLTFTTEFDEAVGDADFVTEAAVEQQAVEEDIFEDIDETAPQGTILATNTSGLNITRLAETTDRPNQVVGTHWFNPPMLMELVEVIMTEHTPNNVADTVEELVESFGKTPIRCKIDIPSFIVNRLMRPYGEGPAWMVYRGEYPIEEIDSAMKYKEGFPMGPFELADFMEGSRSASRVNGITSRTIGQWPTTRRSVRCSTSSTRRTGTDERRVRDTTSTTSATSHGFRSTPGRGSIRC